MTDEESARLALAGSREYMRQDQAEIERLHAELALFRAQLAERTRDSVRIELLEKAGGLDPKLCGPMQWFRLTPELRVRVEKSPAYNTQSDGRFSHWSFVWTLINNDGMVVKVFATLRAAIDAAMEK